MMLSDNGVPLGFGTDSAASNDDIDILSEARFAWNLARATHPHFAQTAEDAVNCLTLQAARIIGHGDRLGSLDQGKLADIAVFYLPRLHESAMQKPYDLLLYGELKLSDLYVDGLKVANMGV